MTLRAVRPEDFRTRVTGWKDVAALIEHFSYFSAHDWLFRGVTDLDHGLIPKVGRAGVRAVKNGERVPYREADEKAVFHMFQQQARAYVSPTPNTRLEWLAVAQHFGLPTRLLDWTESLLVALWFAVEKAGAKRDGNDAAIWVTMGLPTINPESHDDPFSSQAPAIYRPPHVSPRLAAQASVLMLCPQPEQAVSPAFLGRITIDRRVEFLIKKRLNTCGVNMKALFPDLAGLAEHLSWLHRHDYLAGYREPDQKKIGPTADDYPE